MNGGFVVSRILNALKQSFQGLRVKRNVKLHVVLCAVAFMIAVWSCDVRSKIINENAQN